MRAAGLGFAAGLLGMLIGSLAAQGPGRERVGAGDANVIFRGPVVAMTYGDGADPRGRNSVTVEPGTMASVYPGWVVLPGQGRFIPAGQVEMLSFRDGEWRDAATGEFGTDPDPGRPGRPDTFREDN